MKKSRSWLQILENLRRFQGELGGVFRFADLCAVIGGGSEIKNSKVIQRLLREGILHRIWRGIYVVADYDLWVLGSRIKPNSYVSMDSVLAKNALVGTLAARSVSFVYCGRKTVINTPSGETLRFFSIQPELYTGFSMGPKGVQVADNEKAYLDLLYYYMKGTRFLFDPLIEVRTEKLNQKKLNQYLKKYRNPKFVQFVKGLLHEKR